MRPVVIVLAVLVFLGLGAYFAFVGGDDAPPVAPPEAPRTTPPVGPTAPPAQGDGRTAVPAPVPDVPAPSPQGNTTPPSPPPAAAANVRLAVRDLTTRALVPDFRWQFRNSRGTQRGVGEAGRAELALEASAVGQLLVEADGLAPLVREGVIVPTPPAGPLQLDLFLAPAVAAAGITLYVRDLALAPVANVRVDAFPLAADAPPASAWHLGTALWARRAAAADGRYVLPPLPPGHYGIRIVATDAEGALLPLQPYRNVFALTGDNGFVEDVPLEPGALLAVELVDAAGQPFDPSRHGTATLRLQLPGGPLVQRKWFVRTEAAEASAIDVVPGVGKVMLAEAVVAGPYRLEVVVQGGSRAERQLFLRPGVRNEERLVVP